MREFSKSNAGQYLWLAFGVTSSIVSSLFLASVLSPYSSNLHQTVSKPESVLPHIPRDASATSFLSRVEFGDFREYQNITHEYDPFWNDLMTANGGFILQYDVPSGAVQLWGIAMYHQLHCLQLLRMKMQRLLYPDWPLDDQYAVHGDIDTDHYLHCFDYLRQSVLCLADDTMEPVTKEVENGVIADYTKPRMCRRNDDLYSLVSSQP